MFVKITGSDLVNKYDQVLNLFEAYREKRESVEGGYALLKIGGIIYAERIDSEFPDFEPIFVNDWDEGEETFLLGFWTDTEVKQAMILEWGKGYDE